MASLSLDDILPFQEPVMGTNLRQWPPSVHSTFVTISEGPSASHVLTGNKLNDVIVYVRDELQLEELHWGMAEGLSTFFDEVRVLFVGS